MRWDRSRLLAFIICSKERYSQSTESMLGAGSTRKCCKQTNQFTTSFRLSSKNGSSGESSRMYSLSHSSLVHWSQDFRWNAHQMINLWAYLIPARMQNFPSQECELYRRSLFTLYSFITNKCWHIPPKSVVKVRFQGTLISSSSSVCILYFKLQKNLTFLSLLCRYTALVAD